MIKDRYKEFVTDNQTVLNHPYIEDCLIYDIECSSTDIDTANMKFIGFYSYKHKKYILVHKDNRERIQQLIDEHRVVVGYNNKLFDGPIMENGSNQFNMEYKIVLDCLLVLYDMVRHRPNREPIIKNPDGKMLAGILDNRRLNTVAKALGIPVSKGDIDYTIFQKDDWTPEELKEIFTYLYKDINITRQIFEYYVTYFDGFRDLVPDDNIRKFNYIRSSTGSFAYSAVCHLANLPLEFEDDPIKLQQRPENDGGFVLEPQTGYAENVAYLDFASLYPHIMFQCNLFSPHTTTPGMEVLDDDGWSGDGFFPVKGKYNRSEKGKVERILHDIFNQRNTLKQDKNPKELGYKIAINSIYGISGSPIFKSVFNMATSGDCTAIGRKTIQYTREQFEAHGYQVIYGDTDSVFVKIPPGKTVQNLLDLSKSIIAIIKAHMPFPADTFIIDVDDEFNKVWLFKKKHYVGFNSKGKLIIKGIPIIKGDASQLGQLLLKKLKPMMLEQQNIKFKKGFIEQCINEELERDITLIGRMYNVRDPQSYKSTTSIQCQIASAFGEGSHILIPNKTLGDVGKTKKYCTPDQAKKLTIDELFLDKVWHELEPFIA